MKNSKRWKEYINEKILNHRIQKKFDKNFFNVLLHFKNWENLLILACVPPLAIFLYGESISITFISTHLIKFFSIYLQLALYLQWVKSVTADAGTVSQGQQDKT